MIITTLSSFPAGENPFLYDYSNMGTRLGTNVIAMHGKFDTENQPYIILIDVTTGQRIKIEFAPV